ncbi:hypothetical protein JTE90_015858 [Oedothorax gibbosus]|uniref:Uncharacterized protein n=1 Tax=Oedothorax gibbosus TaxID=931172 RepID=A0AAV6VT52_9ARAC|nr:hypothetical protein JTE90_015858 [Oedothorax gibbosus]
MRENFITQNGEFPSLLAKTHLDTTVLTNEDVSQQPRTSALHVAWAFDDWLTVSAYITDKLFLESSLTNHDKLSKERLCPSSILKPLRRRWEGLLFVTLRARRGECDVTHPSPEDAQE